MSDKVIDFTSDNFEQEVVKSSDTVMVDFWAPWCQPCLMMAPEFEAVAEAYAGQAKFGKLNVDEAQEIAGQFGVLSIPTVLVFKDGQVVHQQVGAVGRPELESALKKAL